MQCIGIRVESRIQCFRNFFYTKNPKQYTYKSGNYRLFENLESCRFFDFLSLVDKYFMGQSIWPHYIYRNTFVVHMFMLKCHYVMSCCLVTQCIPFCYHSPTRCNSWYAVSHTSGIEAASLHVISTGRAMAWSSCTVANSALPPPILWGPHTHLDLNWSQDI